jgi:hypothetical protein
MNDKLEAWNDGSAICVIAVGSHGDPLDLAEHEVREFIRRLEACLSNRSREADEQVAAAKLRRSWATTLRHLAACRYYLPKVLATPSAVEAELAWSDYLHNNELELALYEAEVVGMEQDAPAEYWQELRLAAVSMGLEGQVAKFSAKIAA